MLDLSSSCTMQAALDNALSARGLRVAKRHVFQHQNAIHSAIRGMTIACIVPFIVTALFVSNLVSIFFLTSRPHHFRCHLAGSSIPEPRTGPHSRAACRPRSSWIANG